MRELGPEYEGPPKYLNQRDAPLEIPVDVIKSLFLLMDQDMDDKISMTELLAYVRTSEIPIEEDIVYAMFQDASKNRAIIHEQQWHAPLTFEEIQYAVRGRYAWNIEYKQWGISYKPYRDYWILLLLTVNDRLFSLQVPKIIPSKIKAQYEVQDDLTMIKDSIRMGELSFQRAEGIEKNYLSIRNQKKSVFERDLNKPEAGVIPEKDGAIVYGEALKEEQAEQDPFYDCINKKVIKTEGENPKFTFTSKELYGQAHHLCQQIPHWDGNSKNPIYQYVPEAERPFKSSSTSDFFDTSNKNSRENRLLNLSKKDSSSSLRLAGTMSLRARQYSPQSKIRQRKGFVTATKVPDCFNAKVTVEKFNNNLVSKRTGKSESLRVEYSPPKAHKFRDEVEIEPGMSDFALRFKVDKMDNPHALSVFAARPRFITDKEKSKMEQQEAIDKFLAAGKPHDWLQYHKLPSRLEPITSTFPDIHNKVPGSKPENSQFLQKGQWTPAYLELARTMKDDFVYGKPKLDLYFRGLKTEQIGVEFGGTIKPFKAIH